MAKAKRRGAPDWGFANAGDPSKAVIYPHLRLAAAVLRQAALEGLAGGPDACEWLRGDGRIYAEALDFDLNFYDQFVKSLKPGRELTHNQITNPMAAAKRKAYKPRKAAAPGAIVIRIFDPSPVFVGA